MRKKIIRLTDLPDEVVLALRSNDIARLWYAGKRLESIGVTGGGPGKPYAKYRLNCADGQYRSDEPVIEIVT